MPNITADKVKDKKIYAKSKTNGFDGTFIKIKQTYDKGQLIGKVYSYIERPDGLYWMVFSSIGDYANFRPTYIKHDPSKISLPELPSILAEITAQQEKKKIEEKGIIQYNLDKYLPWLIGALAFSFLLPVLKNNYEKK
jgi:hypothetical protein